jgi:hypothetical protein
LYAERLRTSSAQAVKLTFPERAQAGQGEIAGGRSHLGMMEALSLCLPDRTGLLVKTQTRVVAARSSTALKDVLHAGCYGVQPELLFRKRST